MAQFSDSILKAEPEIRKSLGLGQENSTSARSGLAIMG